MDRKLKSSTLIYGLAKYSTILVTLLTTSILARLISPAEYGIVTIVTVFLSMFTVLADMGIGNAVIQNKTLSSDEVDDIFSISVYVSLFLALLFSLLGIPVSIVYGSALYRQIFPIAGFAVFFSTINIIPNALLMRDKRFQLVGKRLISISVLVSICSIYMAYAGFSYYTIVFQQILQSSLTYLWNRRSVSLRFRTHPSWTSLGKIKSYSTYQVLYYFVNILARNCDTILIGKALGSESLAYYDKGYKLMMYPVQNLTMIFNPIIHPILSDYQNDRRFIYTSYLKITRLLSLAGLLITAVCFWAGEEIILLFFGDQWYEAVPVFKLLALSVWPQMIASSAGSIYQSTGNTRLMFRSGMVHFSVTILMIFAGVLTGDLSVIACLVSISLYLRFFIDYYFLVARNFRYRYTEFLYTFAKDALIALALAAAILVCSPIVGTGGFLHLCVKGFIMLGIFLAGLWFTGQHRLIRELVKNKS